MQIWIKQVKTCGCYSRSEITLRLQRLWGWRVKSLMHRTVFLHTSIFTGELFMSKTPYPCLVAYSLKLHSRKTTFLWRVKFKQQVWGVLSVCSELTILNKQTAAWWMNGKTPVSFQQFPLKHTTVPLALFPHPLIQWQTHKWEQTFLFVFGRSNVKHVAWCGQILAWHVKKVQRSAFNHTGMHTETTHWGWTSKWALADFITWENVTHLTYRHVSADL